MYLKGVSKIQIKFMGLNEHHYLYQHHLQVSLILFIHGNKLMFSMISVSNCQFTASISYFSYRKDSLKLYPLLYDNHYEARIRHSYLECYRYSQEEHEHHIVFTHDVGINESLHNFSLSLWSMYLRIITRKTYTGRSDLRPKSVK